MRTRAFSALALLAWTGSAAAQAPGPSPTPDAPAAPSQAPESGQALVDVQVYMVRLTA